MKGADGFAKLFETGQYGRLYILSRELACGATFRVFLLPPGEAAILGPSQGLPINAGTVEVYGAVDGRGDCAATYGWLRPGGWQQDFASLVESRCAAVNAQAPAPGGAALPPAPGTRVRWAAATTSG